MMIGPLLISFSEKLICCGENTILTGSQVFRTRSYLFFNSRYWTPGTDGVDAFAFDWSRHNNWLVPPIYLIPRVLNYLLLCKAKGTLIIPRWYSAAYWPMLVDHNSKFKYFVVDSWLFEDATGLF